MEVLVAHDGQSGIDLALSASPDILLLDLRMPGLDGLDVLARLKQEIPALPVVMLTGSKDVKTAVRATQLGAFDYLTKPFVNDEVVAVVRRALQTRALQRIFHGRSGHIRGSWVSSIKQSSAARRFGLLFSISRIFRRLAPSTRMVQKCFSSRRSELP
jgi:DNA-binding response OmpR family regulator